MCNVHRLSLLKKKKKKRNKERKKERKKKVETKSSPVPVIFLFAHRDPLCPCFHLACICVHAFVKIEDVLISSAFINVFRLLCWSAFS